MIEFQTFSPVDCRDNQPLIHVVYEVVRDVEVMNPLMDRSDFYLIGYA
jgi:hypothetical protein